MIQIPRTVPDDVYNAVERASSSEFADSYLWGASVLSNGVLTLRTQTAYHAIMGQNAVREAIERLGLRIEKPSPFPGDGSRLCVATDLPGYVPREAKKSKAY